MRYLRVVLVLVAAIIMPGLLRAQGTADPNLPRVFSLAIEPSRLDVAARGLSLMPKAEELTKGNAASFYSKAVEAMPADFDMNPVWDWRNTPLRDLPQGHVQAVLEQVKASLDMMSQGARCKICKWPRFASGEIPDGAAAYRQLACLLCVKARLEIAQGRYEETLETIRTGLAASKHIGEAPSIILGLAGVAMADLMLLPVQDLGQVRSTPNLYPAIHSLPHPLVDMEVSISSDHPPWLVRVRMKRELEESYEKTRILMRRLDANVAALECIEALRHFAAGHSGRLPTRLSDITDIQVPNDPTTGKPFAYQVEGSKALLETSIPKSGGPRDSARYEITMTH